MNRPLIAAIVLAIVILATVVVILSTNNFSEAAKKLPNAFVGVAFGGNSVSEGEKLIDRVKDYTNLFVLQSGVLEQDFNSVNELGDYAVAAGMYFLPYFGAYVPATFSAWLAAAQERWGTHLLGVYYGDERGGKMLDDYVYFNDSATGDTITKTIYGDIVVQKTNGIVIQYEMNGNINLYQPNTSDSSDIDNEATFYPNGTIQLVKSSNGMADFTYKSYQELNSTRPFSSLADTAQRFIQGDQTNIDFLKTHQAKVFTSDYSLMWFDYLSGYDVVLGQLGWNQSVTEQIAFLRGAATLQDKDWGVVITWKYQQPPYLDNASAILSQMTTSYECGAKYIVLFDYYPNNQSAYGTLTNQDFQSLQSFWNSAVNHKITQGSIKADSVLVLPANYGWGARWATDHIWGIFQPNNATIQYWNLMQTVLQEHSLRTDIVYADPQYPLPASYQNIYRTN